jgi:hypothetical protein
MGKRMTIAKQQHLSNIALIIIVVLIIVMLVLQVYIITDIRRPILRPVLPAPTHSLPGAWYEKFKNEQGTNTERLVYFAV